MTNLEWSSNDEAWVGSLSGPHFNDLEIRVISHEDGQPMPVSDAQLKAVALIEQIAQTGLPSSDDSARKYATKHLSPNQLADFEDEDFAIDIRAAVVPRLRDTNSSYVIFVGDSDIDIEHGVAILCKDGSKIAVTHSDVAYSDYDWDDTTEFDQILGG